MISLDFETLICLVRCDKKRDTNPLVTVASSLHPKKAPSYEVRVGWSNLRNSF
ncbi:hypothetical protein SAMN05443144_12252 [Fodinibius roseus]|uniref:Uncharacterized protein n=1 Tax=Fodinibius roseus TaxID=1194090 RepID=A0A1M5I846_9BACT|nr:hypothetical protein SAMN05443144_12252 [Fodinibius roseus]